jgi:exodeoxyribonuclease V beta subunit
MEHELEFFYPIKAVTGSGLAGFFKQQMPFFQTCETIWVEDYFKRIPEYIDKLQFSPVKGFMRGFIDLIFAHEQKYYLIDWKSNLLGKSREDYTTQKLRQVMLDDYYFLQYYLYTLALHRYLSYRIKDYDYHKHFGGIYYLFLRGIDASAGPRYGVFHDLPPWEVIKGLENYMLTGD